MNSRTVHLRADNLACARGDAMIFAGVSFALSAGDLMVIRGPNGSGKSSLLRVLGGLIRPSVGQLRCDLGDGNVTGEDLARASHLVGHRGGITDAMTTEENLRFQTLLLGGSLFLVRPALERLGLAAQANMRAQLLSAGQRRRLALARLLTVPRKLWLLDEPTESLDATGEQSMHVLIAEQRAKGGIIVVATHGRPLAHLTLELTLVPPALAVA